MKGERQPTQHSAEQHTPAHTLAGGRLVAVLDVQLAVRVSGHRYCVTDVDYPVEVEPAQRLHVLHGAVLLL